MRDRLPPLNALPAFEAVARHLSVKGAAEQLHVTPGAVSQQLKTLENHLGVELFERVNRGILLTETGRDYLPPIRNALNQIADATRRITASPYTNLLSLKVAPFFASAWLVPRLARFQAAHPAIDLELGSGEGGTDFARDNVDVAIRHGCGGYQGLVSDLIFAVEVVPVAAPGLVERLGMPLTPADLLRWPRLHTAERTGWCAWFRFQGIDELGPHRGTAFGDPGLMLQAVLAGQGVGLLPAAMTALDVEAGRLVRLADVALVDRLAYYLVYPEASRHRPKVAAFRDWLLAEAGRDEIPRADAIHEEGAQPHGPEAAAGRAPRSNAAARRSRAG